MKKGLVLLMAVIMLMSPCLAQGAAGDEDFGYSLPFGEGVTLTCWGFPLPDWGVDDLYNNDHTKWLQDQTGVQIEWVMGPATDRDTKLSLLLSSGEYPEIIFNAGFTPSQEQIYGSQGIILPLNDLIDKYGMETLRVFEQVPDVRKALEREGGQIYSLASYAEDPHGKSFSRMWVYQPWLDALGIALPETTEDFYNMLVMFRDNDPNGNGEKDEIPYMGADNVWWSEVTPYFMNSFLYYDNMTMMALNDGTVEPTYVTEEYREGLRYLNRLFDEGLMLPQTFSQNDQAMRQLLMNELPIVGCFTAHAPFVYCDETVYRDLTPLAPLKGPNGVQYTPQYYDTQTGGTVITNLCKNPEVAFKFMDFMYSTEASMRKSIGIKGEKWEWNTDETLVNSYGLNPSWLIISDDTRPNTLWSLLGHGFQPTEINALHMMNMSPKAIEERENADNAKVDGYVQIEKAAMDVYNNYFPSPDIRMPQVFLFTEDEAMTLADMELAIKNRIAEMRTQFITGGASLDNDWDAYVADLEALGMSEVVGMYQTAYERR